MCNVDASWQQFTARISFLSCSFTFETTVASYVHRRRSLSACGSCYFTWKCKCWRETYALACLLKMKTNQNDPPYDDARVSCLHMRSNYAMATKTVRNVLKMPWTLQTCFQPHFVFHFDSVAFFIVNFAAFFSDSITNLSYTLIFEAKSDPLNFITPV